MRLKRHTPLNKTVVEIRFDVSQQNDSFDELFNYLQEDIQRVVNQQQYEVSFTHLVCCV